MQEKSMRRGMTNVLTLALRDLKGLTSLNPSKKRKKAKKTCLTLGSARHRKRCFRSREPEWPATSSQRSVQERRMCVYVYFQWESGHTKGTGQHTPPGAWNLQQLECERCEIQPDRLMSSALYKHRGRKNRKETIILQCWSQNTQNRERSERGEREGLKHSARQREAHSFPPMSLSLMTTWPQGGFCPAET